MDLGEVDGQREGQRVLVDGVEASVDEVAEVDGQGQQRGGFADDAADAPAAWLRYVGIQKGGADEVSVILNGPLMTSCQYIMRN